MITLYGVGSPNVLKIIIALEEFGLPFKFVSLDLLRGDQYGDEFGALTPNRKVPVITDSEGPDGAPLTLWESGAILVYLSAKSGQLLPTTPRERIITFQWLFFQMAGIGPMFGQHSHFRVYAPEEAHAYSRARYATEVKRLYDVVEKQLAKEKYLAGGDYSIADIAAWPWLHNATGRSVDLASIPATHQWIELIRQRPAVVAAQSFVDSLNSQGMLLRIPKEPDAVDRYVGRGRYSRPDFQ